MIEIIIIFVVFIAAVAGILWSFLKETNDTLYYRPDPLEGLTIVTPQEVRRTIKDHNRVSSNLANLNSVINLTERINNNLEKTKLQEKEFEKRQARLAELKQPPSINKKKTKSAAP